MGRLAVIALVMLLSTCSAPPSTGTVVEDEALARGSASLGGDVVSTVEGHPITRADVAHAAALAQVSPEVALRRLQDELLLALAARRAGVSATDREIAAAERRAAVQVLLAREIEARVTLDDVDEARVLLRFDAELARFERPELRSAVLVMARVQAGSTAVVEDAARAWVTERLAAAAQAPEPSAALLAERRRVHLDLPFEVVVEEMPPVARSDPHERAYLDALFALPEPGLSPTPVRTSAGWSAIAMTEIQPPWEASREDALATLRGEELARLRAERLAALLGHIASSTTIELDPASATQALSRPGLLGDGT